MAINPPPRWLLSHFLSYCLKDCHDIGMLVEVYYTLFVCLSVFNILSSEALPSSWSQVREGAFLSLTTEGRETIFFFFYYLLHISILQI